MNDELEPNPNYKTPIGEISPADVEVLGYGVLAFVGHTALVYAALVGNMYLPSTIGTAALVGLIGSIITAFSVRGHRKGWE